jgi:hypothetical protein
MRDDPILLIRNEVLTTTLVLQQVERGAMISMNESSRTCQPD